MYPLYRSGSKFFCVREPESYARSAAKTSPDHARQYSQNRDVHRHPAASQVFRCCEADHPDALKLRRLQRHSGHR